MKRSAKIIICILFVISFAVTASAFDEQRQGFILGGGFGFASTSYSHTYENGILKITSDNESRMAFTTDFIIGFGTTPQLDVYYMSKVSWFTDSRFYVNNVTIASGVGGVGVTYHLQPGVPSFQISGGIGFSTWSLPFEDYSPDSWFGFGAFIGAGYEYSKHYSANLEILYGNPDDTEFSWTYSAKITSVKLSLNALAY